MADNDNVQTMYEVWWEGPEEDFLIAIFADKGAAEAYLDILAEDDYYVEEAEYE